MMCIKTQIQNFAKLIFIGSIIFIISSLVSHQVLNQVSAKTNNNLIASEGIFAQAENIAVAESPAYNYVDTACVNATLPPIEITPKVLGAIVGENQDIDEEEDKKTIIEYEVQDNDTLARVADKFGVTTNTIIWANDLSQNQKLKAGQKLIIPPVSGVIHYVVAGDTIAQIAEKYRAQIDDIITYNDLSGENDLFIGDVLVIPNGQIVPPPAPKKNISSSNLTSGKNVTQNSTNSIVIPSNYFLCPVGSTCRRTQGLHFRNAVDLTAGYCGAPIYAAASGTVIKAVSGGWNGGAGNNITISHMNGLIITHYYHLQSLTVAAGREVKKGDIIGYEGATGKATGCHLHFEVIGANQPF